MYRMIYLIVLTNERLLINFPEVNTTPILLCNGKFFKIVTTKCDGDLVTTTESAFREKRV